MFLALKPPFAPSYSHPGNNPLSSHLTGGNSTGSEGDVSRMGQRADSGILRGMFVGVTNSPGEGFRSLRSLHVLVNVLSPSGLYPPGVKECLKKTHGKTISRILWPVLTRGLMSIPLDPLSRTGSSCLPGSRNRAGRASWLPYLALHRIRHSRQALSPRLPVVSYATISPLPGTKKLRSLNGNQKRSAPGGLFLWSCSALLRLPVRKYPALWCPDFPLHPRGIQRTSGFPMGLETI